MAPGDILNNRDLARTTQREGCMQACIRVKFEGRFGGPPETRTPDPLIKSQLLYQLS